jgi:hypothetical protein
VHSHDIDVANKYDGEPGCATTEVVFQRPHEITGRATTMLPEVQRPHRAHPYLDPLARGIYRHVNA